MRVAAACSRLEPGVLFQWSERSSAESAPLSIPVTKLYLKLRLVDKAFIASNVPSFYFLIKVEFKYIIYE